jgi:hypothetical protein
MAERFCEAKSPTGKSRSNRIMKWKCLAVLMLVGWTPASGEVPLSWGPHRDLTAVQKPDGVIEITLGKGNPHFWTGVVPASFDPAKHRVFTMEYFAPSGLNSAVLRFRTADGDMVVSQMQQVMRAEAWQPLAFDLSVVPDPPGAGRPDMRFHVTWNGAPGTVVQIRNMRVRPFTAEERVSHVQREQVLAEREAAAEEILAQLRSDWTARIDTVHLGAKDITLIGTTPVPATLHGFGPEFASHRAPKDGPVFADIAPGDFRLNVPRWNSGTDPDRALWRWRLMDADRNWVSAARWPTAKGPAVGQDLPLLQADHPKGLGGIPMIDRADHEIFELGIRHATINVVLNALMVDSPAPGCEPWEFEGRTYYVRQGYLRNKDVTMQHLHQHGIRVTFILLVGNHRHGDGRPHSPLTHPEAESRGIFAMPNLTNDQSTRLYTAAIHFLAKRYTRPDAAFGRVQNWILHNEVDQAGTWTNMGDQPLARYLETYMRSARIVHHTTRIYDRRARVFVSLTHHWTQRSVGVGTYVVRDLIELFAEMARAEGDFDWGVAYHPYPRDLRNPDTWNDAGVSDDFDTHYITPRNIEVLPAFLGQERFLYRGQRRTILLSEQGFNTPTLSKEDQRRQVAGLIYMFRKLQKLPEIEAYHLHRYQDMPDQEGGLRLGIITEIGERKLGWDAYREIGTGSEQEQAFQRMADQVISGQEP